MASQSWAAREFVVQQSYDGRYGRTKAMEYPSGEVARFDYDPQFSEVDWEYLPNGGWGSDKTRLYGVSWQTVQIDPWEAHNSAHEEFGSFDGWHTLLMQVTRPFPLLRDGKRNKKRSRNRGSPACRMGSGGED